MQISKNKKYQYIFFFVLSFFIIFNGGNSNLLIQLNFILLSLFFLICIKDKNYSLHLKNFYTKNKTSIFIYLTFLFFLVFQIIPLPRTLLSSFSPEKYNLLGILDYNSYSTISLAPSNSFFQIMNFLSLLLIVFVCKMVFYTERHKYRFFLFLALMGFISSITAVLLYLNGNPDFLIFKNSYYTNASSGFFINRTVFAVFLLFCLISCFELLRKFDLNYYNKKKDFFISKIYIRLFVIFISIGIITSFSRIGNFLLLITVLFYLLDEIFFHKSNKNSFKIIILFIIAFDIVILGIYFGSSEIIDRFYFLKEEFSNIPGEISGISRFELIKFGFKEAKNYFFFGYGLGGFENLFQIKYNNLSSLFANHAHSDIVEFFGELGLIGFILVNLSFIKFFFKKKNYNLITILVFTYAIIILLFDFSLHIPLIQILFVIFFILSKTNQSSLR